MTNEIRDVELHERVAKIEAQVEHIDAIASERRGQLNRIEQRITGVESQFNEIEKDLERYRGTVGAVLLIGTAIMTFLKLFWNDLLKYFK